MIRFFYHTRLFTITRFFVKLFFRMKERLIRYPYSEKNHPTLPLETIRDYNQHRATGPQKIICNAPFKNMYFKTNGSVTACCINEVNELGNVSGSGLKEIWKGEKAGILREKIERYDLSGGCNSCDHLLKSKNYNAFIGRSYDSFFKPRNTAYPEEMTFEISNTCNLECIMCSENLSSLVRANKYQLDPIENKYGPQFYEELKEFLPHLKKARFLGGEPFLIKEFYPVFDFLHKKNPSCKIIIQTNGTVLNEKVRKIIVRKNVALSISIDSLIKERYESIRKNADFDKVMKNIEYIKQNAARHHRLININFCLMPGNWEEVPDIIQYCHDQSFTLNIIPVEHPEYLSVKSLKPSRIAAIRSELQKLMEMRKMKQTDVFLQLVNYLSYMETYSAARQKKKQILLEETQETLYNELNNRYPVISKNFVNSHLLNKEKMISTIRHTLNGTNDLKTKHVLTDLILRSMETSGQVRLSENTEREILATIRLEVVDLLKKDYTVNY